MWRRAAVAAAVLAVGLAAFPPAASAYEFAVRALTFGQGYQLRWFRPLTGDRLLNRRRFTQTLTLDIWNIGKPPRYARYDATLDRGANYFVTAMLRVDHDFGEYTRDSIDIGVRAFDATDLIPELQASNLGLDVLYAYGGGRGIGGFLDVELGRQLAVDTLDWWSFDGITVRARTPWHVDAELFAGMRVRDSSPAGSSVQEPDGTAGAECAEYVEGAVPGSGAWRPIDRAVPMGDNAFETELEVCPQRDEVMPTFGGAVEASLRGARARLGYRRSVSPTPGLIGPADRFEYADTGLYPNETGRAPGWGVNEERLVASARYDRAFARGRGRLASYAAIRLSLLHGLADEALAGVRLGYGGHSLTPEYFYSFPTFDGDSIFNVFSVRPYHDLRLTYELQPRSSALSVFARGWLHSLGAEDDSADGADQGALAGGAQLGGRYRVGQRSYLRLDLFHDRGFGGTRTGGYGAARWRVRTDLELAGRVSAIAFDEDELSELEGTTLGGQLGASYRLDDGIGMHLTVEHNTNRFYDSQLRAIVVLDLAFAPETR